MLPRARKSWLWLLLPASAAAYLVAAGLLHYGDSYEPPDRPTAAVGEITLPAHPNRLSTSPTRGRQGILLVDKSHRNAFDKEELNSLFSRVAGRGFGVEYLEMNSAETLESALRRASALAVAVPTSFFTGEEVAAVARFVERGGRLLLIGDPGRPSRINTVSDRFGVQFQEGYLYNLADHALNFKNILVRDFRQDDLTVGLKTIALYTAGSIKSTGAPVAFADTNTFSSMVERVEPFSPMVKSGDGRVVAVSDLTFLQPPQNTTLDNDKLVSNLADFLTSGERRFDLADFPHFFRGDVDILLGRSSLFDAGIRLKNILTANEVSAELRGVEDLTMETAFVGLYDDSAAVSQYLEAAGVQAGGRLRTPFTRDIDVSGTALTLLHHAGDRRVLVVLGHDANALEVALDRLESGTFRQGLFSDSLGVFLVDEVVLRLPSARRPVSPPPGNPFDDFDDAFE